MHNYERAISSREANRMSQKLTPIRSLPFVKMVAIHLGVPIHLRCNTPVGPHTDIQAIREMIIKRSKRRRKEEEEAKEGEKENGLIRIRKRMRTELYCCFTSTVNI